MLEDYSGRGGVGTHPAADDGFALKLLLPPAPSERDGHHRAVLAMPNRRSAILTTASYAMLAGTGMATAAGRGEGTHAFPPRISAVRGGRA